MNAMNGTGRTQVVERGLEIAADRGAVAEDQAYRNAGYTPDCQAHQQRSRIEIHRAPRRMSESSTALLKTASGEGRYTGSIRV